MNKKNISLLIMVIISVFVVSAVFFVNVLVRPEINLTEEEIRQKSERAIDFVNENLIQEGSAASLIDSFQENDLIIMEVEVEGNQFESYLSKDGKVFFPEGMKIDDYLFSDQQEEDDSMKSFIECLVEEGMVVYASYTCPACTALAEEFGGYDKVESLFVECSQERERCNLEMKTEFVPEVQINGELYQGSRSLEGFSEKTGCNL